MANNYSIQLENARRIFLLSDPEPGCRRFSLFYDSDFIRIRFLGEEYSVVRKTGQILNSGGGPAEFTVAMSLYDVICRDNGLPILSREFVPVTELSGIASANSVHESLGRSDGRYFQGHISDLTDACLALGGKIGGVGDVCCILPVFDFFPTMLRFWDADDEFPASLQYYWDANALRFVHYETLWFMASAVTSRLRKISSL